MQAFSIDHIYPVGAGGNSTPDNLALACQGCNNHKYNKTHALDLVTGERVALFNPRRQVWSEHFAWNDDCCLVVGISPVGRATVEALRLNRAGVVNLRRVLVGAIIRRIKVQFHGLSIGHAVRLVPSTSRRW